MPQIFAIPNAAIVSYNFSVRNWRHLLRSEIQTRFNYTDTRPNLKINIYTKVIIQGINGYKATNFVRKAINNGTKIVAGITCSDYPRRNKLGIPVYKSVEEAKLATKATATIVYVPPRIAASAIMEAISHQISLIVCVTDNISRRDMIHITWALNKQNKSRLIGPGSLGIIIPGQCNIGLKMTHHRRGSIGIVSTSETLLYEAVQQTTLLGLGQTLSICIGNDAFRGTDFLDCLNIFFMDASCKGVILLGEIIDDSREAEIAEYIIKENYIHGKNFKPIVWYVDVQAPTGQKTGNANANQNVHTTKMYTLKDAGVILIKNRAQMGIKMMQELSRLGLIY